MTSLRLTIHAFHSQGRCTVVLQEPARFLAHLQHRESPSACRPPVFCSALRTSRGFSSFPSAPNALLFSFSEGLFFFGLNVPCTFLHVWSLLRVCMQVWKRTCSEAIVCRPVTWAASIGLLILCFSFAACCATYFFKLLYYVFFPQVCVSLHVSVSMCVSVFITQGHSIAPHGIHPISRSPWWPGPLITEGPGRSNRCASWQCLSSTTVATNLCCTYHTGVCGRPWKAAGALRHCLNVPAWTHLVVGDSQV